VLQDENGNKVTWGGDGTPNEEIWGPEGWCEAEQPSIRSASESALSRPWATVCKGRARQKLYIAHP
jgi:hypothetical protein